MSDLTHYDGCYREHHGCAVAEIMSDTRGKAARPHAELLAEIMDSRIPKTEREHAAAREIERLTRERDELRHDKDRDTCPLVTVRRQAKPNREAKAVSAEDVCDIARLASQHHPDRGGDTHQMARINAARDALLGAA